MRFNVKKSLQSVHFCVCEEQVTISFHKNTDKCELTGGEPKAALSLFCRLVFLSVRISDRELFFVRCSVSLGHVSIKTIHKSKVI